MPLEAYWCTQERMALSNRAVSPSSTSRPSQPNKSRQSTARARLAATAASKSGVGLGTSSGPAIGLASGILGSCFSDGKRCNQVIQFGQQGLVPGARVGLELLNVKRQGKQKRFDLLLAELFPESTITHFVDVVSIEGLLKLVLHRDGEIRLAQMQRLADEGKACVRDYGCGAGQIAEEALHARLLEFNIAVLAFGSKTVRDEPVAHLPEQGGE